MIKATIVITLIIDSQNSNSPNSFALNKFKATNTKIVNAAVSQFGTVGYQYETYLATAVTSAMPEIIQVNQYVHPTINPAIGPI